MTLIERVIVEADAALEAQCRRDPVGQILHVLAHRHQRVLRGRSARTRACHLAGYEARATIPEIGDLWSRFMQKWIDHTAASSRPSEPGARRRMTLPAHDLATALNLMNERALFAAFADERPAVPEDTYSTRWPTSGSPAIYGELADLVRPRCEHMFVPRRRRPSCTLTWIRSMHPSSSVTIPRCAGGR